MRFYKYLYVQELLDKKKDKIIDKLVQKKVLLSCHVVALSVNPKNQLDIYSSKYLFQPGVSTEELFVIAIVKNHDDAFEFLKSFRGTVKQYAVTNGTKVAQDQKLNLSGLREIFDDVFISEELGVEKPGIGFFEKVWDRIGRYKSDEVMIIGDSLTSDMRGGNNAGILCCWYNPKNVVNDKGVRSDYEIDDLQKVREIIF